MIIITLVFEYNVTLVKQNIQSEKEIKILVSNYFFSLLHYFIFYFMIKVSQITEVGVYHFNSVLILHKQQNLFDSFAGCNKKKNFGSNLSMDLNKLSFSIRAFPRGFHIFMEPCTCKIICYVYLFYYMTNCNSSHS